MAGEKSGPSPVSLSKSRQVHFWQGKKVDPVQFPAEIQAGPFLAGEKSGPGSSFAVEIQAGPFLAGENSGPGPVLLLKFRQVQWTWL